MKQKSVSTTTKRSHLSLSLNFTFMTARIPSFMNSCGGALDVERSWTFPELAGRLESGARAVVVAKAARGGDGNAVQMDADAEG